MHEDCYHKMYLNEERHWWFKSKVDIVKALLGRFAPDIGGKKILDAGCGTSFLSKSISGNVNNVYSVDNCDLSLDYSRKRGLINVIKADLNNLPFAGGEFDICLCMDVMEHNEDAPRLVKELGRVLKQGGIIIAAVPAMPALWGPQDEKLGHFKRYAREDFTLLFQDDFEILKLSYFNSLLFPAVYLARKIFNLFPGILKEKDELDINNNFLNNLFYKIFSAEAKILKGFDFPFGVSLIAVTKKK